METSLTLSVLYTQNLLGDLRFLPRLSRVLMRLRAEDEHTVTVDLGGSCAPDAWHCDATDGRSMLVALDGLNYAAVNADALPDTVWPSLMRALVTVNAVSAARPGRWRDVQFVTTPQESYPPGTALALVVRPHVEARVHGINVELPAVERYRIGRMRVRADGPALAIVSVETLDVPPDTPPDATISGMIDFIEAEARQYVKRKQQS